MIQENLLPARGPFHFSIAYSLNYATAKEGFQLADT